MGEGGFMGSLWRMHALGQELSGLGRGHSGRIYDGSLVRHHP